MHINLSQYCCQNEECSLYGQRDKDNLTITSTYGKNKDKAMLRCKKCKKRFSETKGTVYYRAHKSKDKVDSMLRHIQEGVGVRKTSRLEKVHRDTVTRYGRLAGQHAYKLHEELVAFSPLHSEPSI